MTSVITAATSASQAKRSAGPSGPEGAVDELHEPRLDLRSTFQDLVAGRVDLDHEQARERWLGGERVEVGTDRPVKALERRAIRSAASRSSSAEDALARQVRTRR